MDVATAPTAPPSPGFVDQWDHKVDAKGRVFLPADVRHAFVDGVVLAPGPEYVVEVFPRAAFDARQARLRQRTMANADQRRLLRFVNHHAHRTQMDGQGRVMVPQRLRELARLDHELVIAGNDDRLEIWDRERHREAMADCDDLFALDEPAGALEGMPW